MVIALANLHPAAVGLIHRTAKSFGHHHRKGARWIVDRGIEMQSAEIKDPNEQIHTELESCEGSRKESVESCDSGGRGGNSN